MYKIMTFLTGVSILGLCVWVASIAILNWKTRREITRTGNSRPLLLSNSRANKMRLKYFLLLTIQWKTAPMSDKYEVCNYGLVRNKNNQKILTPHLNHCGYWKVKFRCCNKNFRIHRLVMITFDQDMGELMHVNHGDFNRANNAFYNLSWTTPKENIQYNFKNNRGHSKLKIEDVKMVKDMLDNDMSIADISMILGMSENSIRSIRDGKTWKEVA